MWWSGYPVLSRASFSVGVVVCQIPVKIQSLRFTCGTIGRGGVEIFGQPNAPENYAAPLLNGIITELLR